MTKINKMLRSRGGFTLIELMIVIVVLGILAGIAVPRLSNVKTRAKKTAAQSELKTLQTALEMYYTDNDEYPVAGGSANGFEDSGGNFILDGYLDSNSIKSNGSYEYKYSDDGNTSPQSYTVVWPASGTAKLTLKPDGIN